MSNARNLANIIAGTYDIPANSLDNAVPADGSITNAKIASMAASKLTGQVPDANAPSGSVIQVVQNTKYDTFSTNSYPGFVDVTGWSLSITPSSTTSKILIIATCYSGHSESNGFGYVRLQRNGTNIYVGNDRGSATTASADLTQQTAGNVTVIGKPAVITYLDSPATTSAITYKFQARVATNGISLIIGGTWDAGDPNRSNVPTNIIAMEIAG